MGQGAKEWGLYPGSGACKCYNRKLLTSSHMKIHFSFTGFKIETAVHCNTCDSKLDHSKTETQISNSRTTIPCGFLEVELNFLICVYYLFGNKKHKAQARKQTQSTEQKGYEPLHNGTEIPEVYK